MMSNLFLGPYLLISNILLVVVFLSKVSCSRDGVFSQHSLNIAHHYEELRTKHSTSCSYKVIITISYNCILLLNLKNMGLQTLQVPWPKLLIIL